VSQHSIDLCEIFPAGRTRPARAPARRWRA